MDYFTTKFGNDLSKSVSAFKAAQLFLPRKVTETLPTAASVDELKAFPFLDDPTILTNLKSELSVYLATAAGVTPSTVTDAVLWWKNRSNELPVSGPCAKSSDFLPLVATQMNDREQPTS